MTEPLTSAEKQILEIAESEQRIARLQAQIAHLNSIGHPTGTYDALLATYHDTLVLQKQHLALLIRPVGYRCYLLERNSIRAVEIIECFDDADVVVKATAVLDARREFDAVEVWDGARIIARIPR